MMELRKARLSDVEQMHELVNKYANDGLMLARPRSLLYEYIREFTVVEIDNEIVAVGSLNIMWLDLAEVRALAVKEDYIKKGIGSRLVNHLLKEAKELEIPQVFTLTYQPDFFKKLGFVEVNKEKMPQKVWKECINCPKFPNCDEICLVIDIEVS